MSAVEAARGRLSYLPFVARATIAALREYPMLNATLEGERSTVTTTVNLGIAVSLGENGLIVPVIKNAHELSHEGLATRIKDLAERARSKRLDARRGSGRHVHDHEPGRVRGAAGHADHQPAAGGDPRPRGRDQAAGGGERRQHRDPADDLPLHVVGPPRARRRAGGAVPVERAQPPRGVEWLRPDGSRRSPSRCPTGSASRSSMRRSRTRSCCSSTSRCTREVVAPGPRSCRWARTGTGRQGIEVCEARPRRGGDLSRPGPARWLSDHAHRERPRVRGRTRAHDRRRARRRGRRGGGARRR